VPLTTLIALVAARRRILPPIKMRPLAAACTTERTPNPPTSGATATATAAAVAAVIAATITTVIPTMAAAADAADAHDHYESGT
jgi:hypothetical protein